MQLPFDWELNTLVSYGETSDFSGSYDGLNRGALAAALASSDPETALDPYGLGRTSQSVLDGLFNQIFLAPTQGELTFYEASANGPLFALPGGDVMLAAGYERQEFTARLGLARGNPDTPITFREFDRKVDSVYGEMLIPIFGSANAIPGFRELKVTAAVRYDSYSDAGSTTNPQFGIDWRPVDMLTLRGSYGTSFRAPTIPEIYGNSSALFGQSYQNPDGGPPLLGFAQSAPISTSAPRPRPHGPWARTSTRWTICGCRSPISTWPMTTRSRPICRTWPSWRRRINMPAPASSCVVRMRATGCRP